MRSTDTETVAPAGDSHETYTGGATYDAKAQVLRIPVELKNGKKFARLYAVRKWTHPETGGPAYRLSPLDYGKPHGSESKNYDVHVRDGCGCCECWSFLSSGQIGGRHCKHLLAMRTVGLLEFFG